MNQFEELCKLASRENWCWNLCCTTCGHMDFRYSFSELAAGKSPGESEWRIHKGLTSRIKSLGSLPRTYNEEEKSCVLEICIDADIAIIAESCRFPDWLGYLGLVLEHMRTGGENYQKLSSRWASQLKRFVSPGSDADDRMQQILTDDNRVLSLTDLESIERCFVQYKPI